jgi:hypothetical protein
VAGRGYGGTPEREVECEEIVVLWVDEVGLTFGDRGKSCFDICELISRKQESCLLHILSLRRLFLYYCQTVLGGAQ